MRCRAPRGLTLVELVLTLAILAVLATLALPSFGSMVARHRLKAAAENLAVDLAELRLQSAQRRQPMHLDLQAGTQWCYALAVQPGCDCRVPQGCQLKTVRSQDHPGVRLLEGGSLRVDRPTRRQRRLGAAAGARRQPLARGFEPAGPAAGVRDGIGSGRLPGLLTRAGAAAARQHHTCMFMISL